MKMEVSSEGDKDDVLTVGIKFFIEVFVAKILWNC